ncbi:type II secretion system F family protein [Rhodocyclus gracilis]|uniref:Type II secretion system F family protein n=1 Tax=Rhodocyclus tenuis TaxID=1066 RepID=A0A6L5JW32_RHOTE|nr:type II secretion system F family protein [Rhodocyclus gracilis]MQY50992.1 type II secretion system F family protein [Rhodocyclus gracilis]
MEYRIKAVQPGRGLTRLTLDASTPAEASRRAEAMGCTVLSVSGGALSLRPTRKSAFPLLLFTQELLALLRSGISVLEAVEALREKEARPAVRGVLDGIHGALREGKTLSAALEASNTRFPPLFIATVRASERTSSLEEALTRYAAYATQLEALRGKLASAALYPCLLLLVGGLVILFLMGYVVPRFAHIYEDMGGKLPLVSRLLLEWGGFVEQAWPLLLAGGLSVVALIVSAPGRAFLLRQGERLAWKIPALGERLRVFQLARLYRTLSMLLRGGIPAPQSMKMVAGLLSARLAQALERSRHRVSEGTALSAAFEREGLTTPVALRMLRVGERAGNMGEMMERAAAFHDEEMARWADWATRLFGPALMLIMGLVIGVIVVFMYLPIFQLAESVQ